MRVAAVQIAKINAAMQTIVGPVGVSQRNDASNPPMAEIAAIPVAAKAMRSGVAAMRAATAAS